MELTSLTSYAALVAAVTASSLSAIAHEGRGQSIATQNMTKDVAQIAIMMGTPDISLDFIKSISVDETVLGQAPFDMDFTTQIASILYSKGVRKVATVEIMGMDKTLPANQVDTAIAIAANKSRIVYVTQSGSPEENEKLCQHLARDEENVFIWGVGNSAKPINISVESSCLSGNILRVAPLDAGQVGLRADSGFGDSVRIAAAGTDIPVLGTAGKLGSLSGGVAAAAVVAGRMALFASQLPPYVAGSVIVENFLNMYTTRDASLYGKVEEGRKLTK